MKIVPFAALALLVVTSLPASSSHEAPINMTFQAYGLPGFDWDNHGAESCIHCPKDLQAPSILAPADLQSLHYARTCDILTWTGGKPAIDSSPVLGIVYINTDCVMNWAGEGA